MIEDLVNTAIELNIGDETFYMEFDNKAYADVEKFFGKSFIYVYDMLVYEKDLSTSEIISLVCFSLMKHHNRKEIEYVKKELTKNPVLVSKNRLNIYAAYSIPILPVESLKQQKGKNTAKKPSAPVQK